MDTETTVNFVMRLPKPLHKRIVARAKRNVRSLNSEIIVAVQQYLSGEKAIDSEAIQRGEVQPETRPA